MANNFYWLGCMLMVFGVGFISLPFGYLTIKKSKWYFIPWFIIQLIGLIFIVNFDFIVFGHLVHTF
jgi:hypothetical protein